MSMRIYFNDEIEDVNVGDEVITTTSTFDYDNVTGTFTATNNTKHYFADTCVQEGNVYSHPEPEIKGVHLISSYANADIVKTIHNDIMGDINKRIPKGEKLNLLSYVKKVAVFMEIKTYNRRS